MSKEPNDILVMTTCKCREQGTNLVMTRTWFDEQLQSKIAQGVKQERERIVALLQERGLKLETEVTDGDGWSHGRHEEIVFVIKLIEGKEND